MYTRRRALALGGVGIVSLSGCADMAQFAAGEEPLSGISAPAVIDEGVLSETEFELTTRDEQEISEEVEVGGSSRRIEATNHITIYERPLELSRDALVGGNGNGSDNIGNEDIPDDIDDEDIPDDIDEEDIPEGVDKEDVPDDYSQTLRVGGERSDPRQISGDIGEDASSVLVLFTTPAFAVVGQELNPIGQMDDKELLSELTSAFDGFTVGEKQSETTQEVLSSETAVSIFDSTISRAGVDIAATTRFARVTNADDIIIATGVYPSTDAETVGETVTTLFANIEHPA